jgi:hypothetical protein
LKTHASERARWALAGCALALAGACGEDPRPPEVILHVSPAWNADPASTAEIGYEVTVVVELPGRSETCFPLPDLRITVNSSEYPIAAGDCDTEVGVTAWPVRTDADTVVTLSSGHRELGAATFRGLFPGLGALQLVSPADGRVRMGETLALAIPANWLPLYDGRVAVLVHWLDSAASVPPFYWGYSTTAVGTAVEVPTPMATGRALVIVRTLVLPPAPSVVLVQAQACTGFSRCLASASDTLGPVAIEVIP